MGTGQNSVLFVTDILDSEKDTTMKLDAMVSQTTLWAPPGRFTLMGAN